MAHVVEHLAQRVKETSERAARTSDAFMGICSMIDAMAKMVEHDEIGYQLLADTASSVLMLSNEETYQLLNMMENLGLFEVQGDTTSTKYIEVKIQIHSSRRREKSTRSPNTGPGIEGLSVIFRFCDS